MLSSRHGSLFAPRNAHSRDEEARAAQGYAVAAAVAARKLQSIVAQKLIAEEHALAAEYRVKTLQRELERAHSEARQRRARLQQFDYEHRDAEQLMTILRRRVEDAETTASLEVMRPPPVIVPADQIHSPAAPIFHSRRHQVEPKHRHVASARPIRRAEPRPTARSASMAALALSSRRAPGMSSGR